MFGKADKHVNCIDVKDLFDNPRVWGEISDGKMHNVKTWKLNQKNVCIDNDEVDRLKTIKISL